MKHLSLVLIVLLLSCQEIVPPEEINSQTNVTIKHSAKKHMSNIIGVTGKDFRYMKIIINVIS